VKVQQILRQRTAEVAHEIRNDGLQKLLRRFLYLLFLRKSSITSIQSEIAKRGREREREEETPIEYANVTHTTERYRQRGGTKKKKKTKTALCCPPSSH
jgi:hypothetical protein